MNTTFVYLSYFISLNILVCTLPDDCRLTPTHVGGSKKISVCILDVQRLFLFKKEYFHYLVQSSRGFPNVEFTCSQCSVRQLIKQHRLLNYAVDRSVCA